MVNSVCITTIPTLINEGDECVIEHRKHTIINSSSTGYYIEGSPEIWYSCETFNTLYVSVGGREFTEHDIFKVIGHFSIKNLFKKIK